MNITKLLNKPLVLKCIFINWTISAQIRTVSTETLFHSSAYFRGKTTNSAARLRIRRVRKTVVPGYIMVVS